MSEPLKPATPADVLRQERIQNLMTWAQEAMDRECYEDAVTPLHSAVTINPENRRGHEMLGFCLLRTGHFQEAVDSLMKALQLNPPLCDEIHFNLSCAFYGMEKYHEAWHFIQKALEAKPEKAAYVFQGSCCLREKGYHEESLSYLRKAVRLDPECADYHYALGCTLMAEEKRAVAVHSFRMAVRLDPESAIYRRDLGYCMRELGKISEAMTCLKIALGNPVFADKADRENAQAAYSQLLNRHVIEPLREAAALIKNRQADDHVLQVLRQVAAMDKPDFLGGACPLEKSYFWIAWHNIGSIYMGREDYAKAEHAFSCALEYQDCAPTHFNLAACLELQGYLGRAQHHFLQAVTKGTEGQTGQRAQEHLADLSERIRYYDPERLPGSDEPMP